MMGGKRADTGLAFGPEVSPMHSSGSRYPTAIEIAEKACPAE
jgi:hypothetical protein